MTLAWMLYAVVISALIGLAALFIERAAHFLRLPARHVWLAAIILGAIWPFAVLVLELQPGSELSVTQNVVPFAAAIESVSRAVVQSAGPAWLARLDILVFALWACVSAALLWRLATDNRRMRRLKESWNQTQIDGQLVRVARESGPAVVGTTDMEIVIPEWTLNFDATLRALILRHENEHRIARDPLVLQLSRVVVAVFPWNLPLHWLVRRLAIAVEIDCDARVLRAHPDSDRYTKLLVAVALLRSAPRGEPALGLMESATQLEMRILAMRRTVVRRSSFRASIAVAGAILMIAVACDVREPSRPQAPSGDPSAVMKREVATPGAISADQPYFAYEVSQMARFVSGPAPVYPRILRETRQKGKVLAQFVVDTAGRVDMATFKVIQSSNALFDVEVRKVLPQYRFIAADIQGTRVSMYVQLPFEFILK